MAARQSRREDRVVANVTVRPATADDEVASILDRAWFGSEVIVHGRTFRLDDLPTLVAVDGPTILGVLTYELRTNEVEIVSCNSFRRRTGVGRALVEAVTALAAQANVGTVVCTTTNDNVGALAFWQGVGLRIEAIRSGAVDEARRQKPSIPLVGEHGIEIHDELDLRGSVCVHAHGDENAGS